MSESELVHEHFAEHADRIDRAFEQIAKIEEDAKNWRHEFSERMTTHVNDMMTLEQQSNSDKISGIHRHLERSEETLKLRLDNAAQSIKLIVAEDLAARDKEMRRFTENRIYIAASIFAVAIVALVWFKSNVLANSAPEVDMIELLREIRKTESQQSLMRRDSGGKNETYNNLNSVAGLPRHSSQI